MAEQDVFLLNGEEIAITDLWHTRCSGGPAPSLGHPTEYLTLEKGGEAVCGYCDRRFVHSSTPMAKEVREKGEAFTG